MELRYVRLLTNNFADLVEFYEKKLDLELTHRDDPSQYAELKCGSAAISIFSQQFMTRAMGMVEDSAIHECQDKKMIIFGVEDVEKTRNTLKSKNVIFLKDLTDRPEWGTKTIHFRDTDGNIIEIYQNTTD